MTILVTGATGNIGGRLATRLLARGHRVRDMARDPRRLGALAAAGAECVSGDVLQPESLAPALDGVAVAYYLIHSMSSGADFAQLDHAAAGNFAAGRYPPERTMAAGERVAGRTLRRSGETRRRNRASRRM